MNSKKDKSLTQVLSLLVVAFTIFAVGCSEDDNKEDNSDVNPKLFGFYSSKQIVDAKQKFDAGDRKQACLDIAPNNVNDELYLVEAGPTTKTYSVSRCLWPTTPLTSSEDPVEFVCDFKGEATAGQFFTKAKAKWFVNGWKISSQSLKITVEQEYEVRVPKEKSVGPTEAPETSVSTNMQLTAGHHSGTPTVPRQSTPPKTGGDVDSQDNEEEEKFDVVKKSKVEQFVLYPLSSEKVEAIAKEMMIQKCK